jgi:hypothetical protein
MITSGLHVQAVSDGEAATVADRLLDLVDEREREVVTADGRIAVSSLGTTSSPTRYVPGTRTPSDVLGLT